MTPEVAFTASLYTHAGPEIGVASTKCLHRPAGGAGTWLPSTSAGSPRAPCRPREPSRCTCTRLVEIPHRMLRGRCPGRRHEVKRPGPASFISGHQELPLPRPRRRCYPMALEGALKLKEISLHPRRGLRRRRDEARPHRAHRREHAGAGGRPARAEITYDKIIGNIEEVRARGGKVIRRGGARRRRAAGLADHVLRVPPSSALLAPLVATIPLQQLAYHVADLRGTDVDQPRNRAQRPVEVVVTSSGRCPPAIFGGGPPPGGANVGAATPGGGRA